ncbi:hypothetical protein NDU88_005969 [Pleurodeles waltl]|uniref:Uncharacterized protein n=1 Tax=Pleurodeles waltl TaxID=8319 RepID=A0AAV7MXV1_PLEWA|nr:hypothetical protein NDU88_005969 [Pleurodeles waltl]
MGLCPSSLSIIAGVQRAWEVAGSPLRLAVRTPFFFPCVPRSFPGSLERGPDKDSCYIVDGATAHINTLTKNLFHISDSFEELIIPPRDFKLVEQALEISRVGYDISMLNGTLKIRLAQ